MKEALTSLNNKIDTKSVFSTVATQTDCPQEIEEMILERREVSIQASLDSERQIDNVAPS